MAPNRRPQRTLTRGEARPYGVPPNRPGRSPAARAWQMADSVTGQTVVDPKGYLTDLNSIVLKSDAEIG